MFVVNGETGAVEMNVGDTGAWFIDGERDDGVPFTENDRAVFTIKNKSDETVLERIYGLADDDGLGNGTILVQLDNNDTDDWDPGQYTYEVRYVVNPYYIDGKIRSGDIVDTPGITGKGDPIPMTLKQVQAYI